MPRRPLVPLRRALGPALLAGALVVSSCGESRRSAAALVSREDPRPIPPERLPTAPNRTAERADAGRAAGPLTAEVRLFVVSDYLCEPCRRFARDVMPVLRTEYADRGVAWVSVVHYPLRRHRNAVAAANAAMCAAAQGGFWDAHANIFARAEDWRDADDPAPTLDALATVPGVDGILLRGCTESRALLPRIRADIDWVDAVGAGRPPMLVVRRRDRPDSPRLVPGDTPLPAIRAILDSALAGR